MVGQESNFFHAIARNQILWAAIISWALAQGSKIVSGLIKEHKFDFRWIMGSGGMPSSHSAGVSGLATAVGLQQGFDSLVFATTFIFALVIMFDAQGARRMAGMQAKRLNRLIEDLYLNRGITEERLRELIGHTPVEVLMGALLGIAAAIVVMTS